MSEQFAQPSEAPPAQPSKAPPAQPSEAPPAQPSALSTPSSQPFITVVIPTFDERASKLLTIPVAMPAPGLPNWPVVRSMKTATINQAFELAENYEKKNGSKN